MARFVKGDIVLLPFPFSGEQAYKHRPALILASWNYEGGTDHLVCLITTQLADDPYLTELLRSRHRGCFVDKSGAISGQRTCSRRANG